MTGYTELVLKTFGMLDYYPQRHHFMTIILWYSDIEVLGLLVESEIVLSTRYGKDRVFINQQRPLINKVLQLVN